MNNKSISVVIPNYNGKQLLEANLPSVYTALKSAQVNYEIIVVDDASSDDSCTFIQEHYPDIKLLKNELNQGFSPTINKGIFASSCDLVLALNSDVKLTPDYFKEQFKYFESPETFGVMGKIIDPLDRKIQDGAKFPSVNFKGIKVTYNYISLKEPINTWLPSFFLSGANALTDRKKLFQLKGFDELYAPYYYEDADLGIRAWRVGWNCYFEPKSICIHTTSSSIGKVKKEKVQIIAERNRIIFNHLHLGNKQLQGFKIWLQLRCFIDLLKGRKIIYNAIKLFKKDRLKLQKSQEALALLQQQNQQVRTIYDIENNIAETLKSIPHRIF